MVEEKVIEKDYACTFQADTGNEASTIEKIKSINETILQVENKLYANWSMLKKRYLLYKTKCKKADRLTKEFDNQALTLDAIIKYASQSYK